MRTVDYLEEDTPIAGQKFFLVSHAKLQDGSWWMKIRGAWDSLEQAERVAKRLMKSNDAFDIVAGEVGKWVPALPTQDNCERVEYSDERLNDLFKGYAEGQRAAKEHFHERKEKVMREGIDKHLLPEEIVPEGSGPPPPMSERELREAALAEAESMHPAERAAMGLPERESSSVDLPLTRSSAWQAA